MQTQWSFDPAYTTVEFSVKQLFFFTVKGRLSPLDGTLVLDDADISRSSISAFIKAAGIDTGNQRRDAHLRSADFIDATTYPNIEFRSATIERGRDRDALDLSGDLTIRGRTARVALAVNEMDRSRSPKGEEFIYYSATTELDRFDFGINYGRGIIGRKLKVTINVQAKR